jgi:hypothetical protein
MKRWLGIVIALAVLGAGLAMTLRTALIERAEANADALLEETDGPVSTTQRLYDFFEHDNHTTYPALARLRPYLTSDYLPAALRFPHGTIELFMMEGTCDDAARALIYLLHKQGISARPWNMIGRENAHSAVIAEVDDKKLLLDPYYGYAGPLDHPKPLDETSNRDFYKDYDKRAMGAAGESLTIPIRIPAKQLVLGTIDGDSDDVRKAMQNNRMTPVGFYLGHKFERGWIREWVAKAPLRMDFILTRRADSGILRTLAPAPALHGTKLSWHLLKGEKIISEDGKAPISLLRMNSYIDIDQIIITPDNGTTGDTP